MGRKGLHIAAFYGHKGNVESLVDLGAGIDADDTLKLVPPPTQCIAAARRDCEPTASGVLKAQAEDAEGCEDDIVEGSASEAGQDGDVGH